MKPSYKVLILSGSEICHNPRLIKAADSYFKAGYEVKVWNIVTGLANNKLHKDFSQRKPWQIIDVNISKNNPGSYGLWLVSSLINLASKMSWKVFRHNTFLYKYYMSKGAIGFKKPFTPKFIHTNVIDLLPVCVQLKKKYGADLIFDSQELFSGQYEHSQNDLKDWIINTEKTYLKEANILLTTTSIMSEKLKNNYTLNQAPIRVRNLPAKTHIIEDRIKSQPLKLVWHGFAVYLESRGIQILLDAIKKCQTPVILYLQGKISVEEKIKILNHLGKEKEDLIQFVPPADPELIVESLFGYDVGLIGEQPLNTNQLYTSSNKLFDYLHAGLPVVTSNMPGIIETIEEYKVGCIYPSSDSDQLANHIDILNTNSKLYKQLKLNAIKFAAEFSWNSDFKKVLERIEKDN